MGRRGVPSRMRRQLALPRSCCARVVLSLLVLALPLLVHAKAPSLDAPSLATRGTTGEQLLPPPDKPVPPQPGPQSNQPQEPAAPTPAAATPTLPPPPQHIAAEAKQSKPPEDLAVALDRPG